jgi:hypothetical protein
MCFETRRCMGLKGIRIVNYINYVISKIKISNVTDYNETDMNIDNFIYGVNCNGKMINLSLK